MRAPLVLYHEKQENLPSFFNEALGTPDYAASAYSNSTLSLAFIKV